MRGSQQIRKPNVRNATPDCFFLRPTLRRKTQRGHHKGDNMSVRSTLFARNTPRTIARTAAALFTVALITACATDHPAPTGLDARLNASRGAPFTEGLASPGWQETARNLVSQAFYTPIQATRVYPILGVAQYLAVQRAEGGNRNDENVGGNVKDSNDEAATGNGTGAGGRKRLETDRGAVAGASVVTLS